MTAALTVNIILAALVLTAVVGTIAWSIATQSVDAATRIARTPRRRRRTTARPHLAARTVEHRA